MIVPFDAVGRRSPDVAVPDRPRKTVYDIISCLPEKRRVITVSQQVPKITIRDALIYIAQTLVRMECTLNHAAPSALIIQMMLERANDVVQAGPTDYSAAHTELCRRYEV